MFKSIINIVSGWLSIKNNKLESACIPELIADLESSKDSMTLDIYRKVTEANELIASMTDSQARIEKEMNSADATARRALAEGDTDTAAEAQLSYEGHKANYDRYTQLIKDASDKRDEFIAEKNVELKNFDIRIDAIRCEQQANSIAESRNKLINLGFSLDDDNIQSKADHVEGLIRSKSNHLEAENQAAEQLGFSKKKSVKAAELKAAREEALARLTARTASGAEQQ